MYDYRLSKKHFHVDLQKCWRHEIEVTLKTNNEKNEAAKPTGIKLKILVRKALEILATADYYASDGKFVVTVKKLGGLSCSVADENEPSKLYTVKLSEPLNIDFGQILEFLRDTKTKWASSQITDPMATFITPSDALDTLGLILSHTARNKQGITTVGRSRFFDTGDQQSREPLSDSEWNLKIIRGFRQSVRPTDDSFLLNINATTAVFIPVTSVAYFISNSAWFEDKPRKDMTKYQALAARLVGARIAYKAGSKTRFKTIQGLGEKRTQNGSLPLFPHEHVFTLKAVNENMSAKLQAKFEESKRNGEYKISVQDYFEFQFGVKLSQELPLIDLAMDREGPVIPESQKSPIKGIHLVVLPDNNMDAKKIYGLVKKLGDIDFGFHTVSITPRKLTSPDKGGDIRGNVALKFNLKAGGINHLVKSKSMGFGLPFIGEGDTMVVGYDVSHPTGVGFSKEPGKGSAGEGKKPEDVKPPPPSFVGLVASVDKYLNNWPAVAWTNKSRVEMLDREKLRNSLKSRLELWKSRNEKFPGHIIVYRDGVSEGQYKEVLDVEVEAIREVCKEYGGETPIKLLFIITAKRHNTRFYLKPKNRGLPVSNPKNGLVVDSGITVTRNWDFFLQPHHCSRGTARPIHYIVLYDDFFRRRYDSGAANQLEQLTHDMSYSYGRATKAVSICPPVYYADLVCTRAKLHYEEHKIRPSPQAGAADYDPLKIHANVADRMYYI
ncbi:putative eukaryotic translation initiation factor 2c 3 protein [Eutypa lata UCREL1]|uniref:Putative eukaryotic translation initiation factor 2c 3 protein n=1 Tax=Eutypa lata (strain UCR-EL1) TaxID=1287681 RepID=M7SYJ0_EUTLA|nr:putative eukaryotic translation initiation factor 2c 3 protein [Eutypa lata UCREL1]